MKGFFLLFVLLEHLVTSFSNAETASRIVGLVHHLPAIKFAYSVLSDHRFWLDKENYMTQWSHIMISYTLAYFMFDIIYLIKYHWPPKKKLGFFAHAVACTITYAYMYEHKKYHFFGAAFLTWELSTPCLYISWFLANNRLENSLLYRLNGILFTLTFFTFRIVFGSYVVYSLVWPLINNYLRIVAVTLTGLNYYWFFKIIHKMKAVM